jgi:hypothetical protein
MFPTPTAARHGSLVLGPLADERLERTDVLVTAVTAKSGASECRPVGARDADIRIDDHASADALTDLHKQSGFWHTPSIAAVCANDIEHAGRCPVKEVML